MKASHREKSCSECLLHLVSLFLSGSSRNVSITHCSNNALRTDIISPLSLSGSSASYEVVCRLLEANPEAANLRDADGLYPMDIICRSSHRGASDVLKALLRYAKELLKLFALQSSDCLLSAGQVHRRLVYLWTIV